MALELKQSHVGEYLPVLGGKMPNYLCREAEGLHGMVTSENAFLLNYASSYNF